MAPRTLVRPAGSAGTVSHIAPCSNAGRRWVSWANVSLHWHAVPAKAGVFTIEETRARDFCFGSSPGISVSSVLSVVNYLIGAVVLKVAPGYHGFMYLRL